jgi:hypothetical protein
VIYFGHSLAGALIKLTNLQNDASPLEVHLTDSEGRATFTLPSSGTPPGHCGQVSPRHWVKALSG